MRNENVSNEHISDKEVREPLKQGFGTGRPQLLSRILKNGEKKEIISL